MAVACGAIMHVGHVLQNQEHNPQPVCYVHIHSTHSLLYGRASHAQRKCGTTTNLLLSKQEAQVKDPDDPKQAHLSYGNNPLHDAARDGDMVLLTKILERVPGTFTDNRFSKWSVMCFEILEMHCESAQRDIA